MVHSETAPVSRSGQVTIPREIRESLGIDPSDEVVFQSHDDDTVTMERLRPPAEIVGVAADRESGATSATEILRESRKRDERELECAIRRVDRS